MELEASWGRIVRVWWSLFWRSILGVIVSLIPSAIVGGIVGFVFAMIGLPQSVAQIVGGLLGFVFGIGIHIFVVKMLIGKDFGEFRLVLLKK